MANLVSIDKCEIVASFQKAKNLRAAVREIVTLGIPRYDINATLRLWSKTDDEKDGYYAIWVWIRNLAHVDRVTEILDRRGGENIHIDDRNEVTPKRAKAYNVQAALNDPQKVFVTPNALLKSHFAAEVKRDLLHRWAYDIRQQQKADDEGMKIVESVDILAEIETALSNLRSVS